MTQEAQREQAMERMAGRGAKIVVVVGFQNATPLEDRQGHPDTKFTIIDSVVDLPNVQSVTFKDAGSFLVGMAAVMASKTGKVGFVGGMDIPLIRNFQFGYEQGVKHASGSASVLANYTGTAPAAWNDPARGGELAIGQFDQGADVVYAAAGATGLGVLQAAADKGKLSIGVDSNQNHLHPGSVLTSMLKRVRRRCLQGLQGCPGRHLAGRCAEPGPEGGRRRLRAGREQPPAHNARHGEEAGRGEGGHHRRPARGQGLLLDPEIVAVAAGAAAPAAHSRRRSSCVASASASVPSRPTATST